MTFLKNEGVRHARVQTKRFFLHEISKTLSGKLQGNKVTVMLKSERDYIERAKQLLEHISLTLL